MLTIDKNFYFFVLDHETEYGPFASVKETMEAINASTESLGQLIIYEQTDRDLILIGGINHQINKNG